MIRILYKLPIFVFCLILHFILGLIGLGVRRIHFQSGQMILGFLLKWNSRILLAVLGVHFQCENDFEKIASGSLIVSNHMSYLDMLIIVSQVKGVFVTSQDLKETPFLGQIAEIAGCVFVERRKDKRKADGLNLEIEQLASYLTKGQNIILFPEATSTDGQQVKDFKRPLFRSAVIAQKNTALLCLNYKEVEGEVFSRFNADKICWYGSMSFFPHFLQLMQLDSIQVQLSFLGNLSFREEKDFGDLARIGHQTISQYYQKTLFQASSNDQNYLSHSTENPIKSRGGA